MRDQLAYISKLSVSPNQFIKSVSFSTQHRQFGINPIDITYPNLKSRRDGQDPITKQLYQCASHMHHDDVGMYYGCKLGSKSILLDRLALTGDFPFFDTHEYI